jgi:zinc protease
MKRLFHSLTALLVTGLLWAHPAGVQAQTAPAAAQAQQFTLANGMTLIVKPDRRAPTVAHMLWVRVGAMDEVDGTWGVAHVL